MSPTLPPPPPPSTRLPGASIVLRWEPTSDTDLVDVAVPSGSNVGRIFAIADDGKDRRITRNQYKPKTKLPSNDFSQHHIGSSNRIDKIPKARIEIKKNAIRFRGSEINRESFSVVRGKNDVTPLLVLGILKLGIYLPHILILLRENRIAKYNFMSFIFSFSKSWYDDNGCQSRQHSSFNAKMIVKINSGREEQQFSLTATTMVIQGNIGR